jgi:hypothetical protein
MRSAEQLPIACTLDSGRLATRLGRIADLTQTSLLSHQLTGRELRLAYDPHAADEVRKIVALERSCCAFLDFDLQETAARVVLTITAPAHAGDSAEWLLHHFMPRENQPRRESCGCSAQRSCG